MTAMIVLTIASTSAGIYGLRGLYYTLFQQTRIPLVLTGSAAGIVSVVGYTPDIFMGPLMGWILDRYPGSTGHEYLFLLLAFFALAGALLSLIYHQQVKTKAMKVVKR